MRSPYLDLHLDLQVSPVDGEQCAARAGGTHVDVHPQYAVGGPVLVHEKV